MIRNTIRNTIQNTIRNTLGEDAFNMLNLFSGGQRGVWYDPSDLATMFQESTGVTAVTADGQPVGLMLDKSRGELFGDELVTNGTFDTDLSGWVNGAVATTVLQQSNGTIEITPSGGVGRVDLSPPLSIEVGKNYTFVGECTQKSGNSESFIHLGTSAGGVQYAANIGRFEPIGLYTYTFTATATQLYIQLGAISNPVNYDNISVKEVIGIPAQQPVSTKRPTYKDTPDRLEIDLVDDALLFDVPTGGIDGYMVIGTNDGTASYGVSLPEGSYELGGDYFPSNTINGFLLREGSVSQADLANVEKDFVSKGAKASYGDVIDFANYWRGKNITEFPLIDTSSGTTFFLAWYRNNLTSFPLIDTSNGVNFSYAWHGNSLTSFPLIDTSSGTTFNNAWRDNNLTSFPLLDTSSGIDFQSAWYGNSLSSFPLLDTSSGTNFAYAWYNNSTLSDFPANMFDNCLATNFTDVFGNTGLTQSSIDGILVSINSNGTSNGTFNQTGGSAPSATGQSSIDAMRSRGWTITVTGGY